MSRNRTGIYIKFNKYYLIILYVRLFDLRAIFFKLETNISISSAIKEPSHNDTNYYLNAYSIQQNLNEIQE